MSPATCVSFEVTITGRPGFSAVVAHNDRLKCAEAIGRQAEREGEPVLPAAINVRYLPDFDHLAAAAEPRKWLGWRYDPPGEGPGFGCLATEVEQLRRLMAHAYCRRLVRTTLIEPEGAPAKVVFLDCTVWWIVQTAKYQVEGRGQTTEYETATEVCDYVFRSKDPPPDLGTDHDIADLIY